MGPSLFAGSGGGEDGYAPLLLAEAAFACSPARKEGRWQGARKQEAPTTREKRREAALSGRGFAKGRVRRWAENASEAQWHAFALQS